MKNKIKVFLLLAISIFLFSPQAKAQDTNYLSVKVGQSYEANEKVNILTEDYFIIYDEHLNAITPLNSDKLTVELNSNNKIMLNSGSLNVEFPSDGTMVLGNANKNIVTIGDKSYMGFVSFRINDNRLDLINYVELEDYLRGVLPKELSPSYPHEALKAQAVASRSFALSNREKYISKGYNLNDTTSSQVYHGISVHDPRTDSAIAETAGVYAYYDGSIANTIFHATSGGITESSKNAWGGSEINYLTTIEDDFSNYNNYNDWTYEIDKDKLNSYILKKIKGIGEVRELSIAQTTSSGRVKTLKVVGSKGEGTLSGNDFRSFFGSTNVKSTLFYFKISDNNISSIWSSSLQDSLVLEGKGYGHGVGMSQYGAVEMAKRGMDYIDILSYYYPGIIID